MAESHSSKQSAQCSVLLNFLLFALQNTLDFLFAALTLDFLLNATVAEKEESHHASQNQSQ